MRRVLAKYNKARGNCKSRMGNCRETKIHVACFLCRNGGESTKLSIDRSDGLHRNSNLTDRFLRLIRDSLGLHAYP
jgi:hypothetical protein